MAAPTIPPVVQSGLTSLGDRLFGSASLPNLSSRIGATGPVHVPLPQWSGGPLPRYVGPNVTANVGSIPSGIGAPNMVGAYQPAAVSGGRLAGLAGNVPRIPGTQVQFGNPGFRAGLMRGLGGLGIHYAGTAAANAMGGQDTAAGRTTQAATLGGSVGSAFGAPGAAVGAAGMTLGQGAYELVSEGDNSIANVGTNISRAFGGGGGSFGQAVDRGVDPVRVIHAMRLGDEESVVRLIADSGMSGVTDDGNGNITLEGDALQAIEAARSMTNPDNDDPFNQLMFDLAESGADDEEIQATIDTYGAMLAEDPEADPATVASQARDYVTSQKEALAAENQAAESRLAEIAAFQQQVQQYMAPVTGGMRQRADMMRESTQQTLANANLPSGMAAGLQMQMDAQYQGQMAMADAYDRQIAITPSMVMQQEAQAQTSALADQLLQAMYVQPAVTQMTQPQVTGLEGIDPALLGLVTG